MVDNYNIIKPVESLQNIGNLSPVDRRKKKKQQSKEQKQQEKQQELNESTEEIIDDEITTNEIDPHSIDYRA